MRVISYQYHPDGSSVRFHKAENRAYQRVVAGVSEPGSRPGAIVVIGEGVAHRPPFQYYWLGESQAATADDLIEQLPELKINFQIQDFYGRPNTDNTKTALEIFNRKCREASMPKKCIEILPAPLSDTPVIASHITILRSLLKPDSKQLHFGASEIIPGALQELPEGEIADATAADYPVIAALGFCVAALVEWPYVQKDNKKLDFAKHEYDVLNYGQ